LAAFVFLNPTILVNAVDMSAMCKKATLNIDVAEQETTAFSTSTKPFRTRVAGLRDWSVDLDFNQDFAASQVDATLFPILGTVVAFELRNQAGAGSTTNPAYRGNVLISTYQVADGSVGDLAHSSVKWPGASAIFAQTT
jgi:hypothetical protein